MAISKSAKRHAKQLQSIANNLRNLHQEMVLSGIWATAAQIQVMRIRDEVEEVSEYISQSVKYETNLLEPLGKKQ